MTPERIKKLAAKVKLYVKSGEDHFSGFMKYTGAPDREWDDIQDDIEAAIREAVEETKEAAAKVVQKAPNERTWVCPEDAPAVSVLIPPSQAGLAALIRAMKEAE